jgi:hypothetical protein
VESIRPTGDPGEVRVLAGTEVAVAGVGLERGAGSPTDEFAVPDRPSSFSNRTSVRCWQQ